MRFLQLMLPAICGISGIFLGLFLVDCANANPLKYYEVKSYEQNIEYPEKNEKDMTLFVKWSGPTPFVEAPVQFITYIPKGTLHGIDKDHWKGWVHLPTANGPIVVTARWYDPNTGYYDPGVSNWSIDSNSEMLDHTIYVDEPRRALLMLTGLTSLGMLRFLKK